MTDERREPRSGGSAPTGGGLRRRRTRRGVYVISVAAELSGMHPQTLRIYERKGLIEPDRTHGGSRRYSDEDLERLQRIADLTEEGLNLAGVKRVLELEREVARLRAELEEARAAVEEARADARRAVEEAHRQHRRELVPVSRAVVPYGRGLRIFFGE